MTMDRIKTSWDMSKFKGEKNKIQNAFNDEGCIRTVTRHLCKPLINQSDDSRQYITDGDIVEEKGFDPHEVVTGEENQLPAATEPQKGLPAATVKMTIPPKKTAEPVPVQQSQEAPGQLFQNQADDDPTNTANW